MLGRDGDQVATDVVRQGGNGRSRVLRQRGAPGVGVLGRFPRVREGMLVILRSYDNEGGKEEEGGGDMIPLTVTGRRVNK
jgi:hypothetical protein